MKDVQQFVLAYVLARAPAFRLGHEKEDAWQTIQDATRIYEMMAVQADRYDASRGLGAGQAINRSGPPMTASVFGMPMDKMTRTQADEILRLLKGQKV